MRRRAVLAGGLLLAAAAVVANLGAGPTAEIQGDPLDSKAAKADPKAAAQEAAAYAALADKTALRGDLPVTKPTPPAPPLAVDLDRVERVDDHYEAPLADGRTAILTLEPALQELAEQLLVQARAPRGAIVAMAPDGRILALAGRRTAETKGGTNGTADWHLATDVWAPAASVFKLVTASALVAAGVDPDDKVCYHGGIRSVSESNLRDDRHDNDCKNLAYGVAHSNNAIVGKLAFQKLEPNALDKLARDFGCASPIDAVGVPATFGELALPQQKNLDFAQAAAGFSGSRLSVLGGAVLAATFADVGEQPTARLVDSIVGAPATTPAPAGHRVLAEPVARAVGKMMVETCDSGSAAKSFGRRRDLKVAGKTGTLSTTQPFYMEHSWFVGYAPAAKPEIIVAVLLGNPENWHLRGHEAARRMIDRAVRRAEDRDAKPADRQAKRR